jgi:catechol 2,3-dioxygenase-like lactoylglutathione lyase family enzyme
VVKTYGLTHIALAAQDVERAFAFYRDVFGMVLVYRDNGFVQAQTPGSRDVLVLEERPGHARGSGGIAHFGFRLVDPNDIDEAARGGGARRRRDSQPRRVLPGRAVCVLPGSRRLRGRDLARAPDVDRSGLGASARRA